MSVDLTPSVDHTTLADFTRAALVMPTLRERDAAGVINELTRLLQSEGCVPDMLPFYHAALNQELLGNSALACGIALPHARLSGIRQLQFAFGRAPQPLPWGEKWSTPAEFVFLLAVPATDAAKYLHLLASLARLGQQPGLLQELRDAEEREGILRVLEKVRLRQGC
jgi:mannitol/fructose-specific phosphotransferase system IIA component (Ntr-type)